MFKVPEQFRRTRGKFASDSTLGNYGVFEFASIEPRRMLLCIASEDLGWEHVSIHAEKRNAVLIPYWSEMCQVKDLFWEAEDLVVQYHAKKSEWVNCHPATLHLWKPAGGVEIPRPPAILVGGGDPK